MRLIRPFLIDDAALVSSSIGEGSGALALEGDMTDGNDAEALEGDESGLLLLEGDEAAADEWDAATIYALDDIVTVTATDYHHSFQSLTGGTSHTATVTIATPGVVSWTAHGLVAGTPILFTTTGALPTGLSPSTVYYVLAPATDTFTLAATVGGAAINTTGSQSGVHTAIASPNFNKNPTAAGNEGYWLDLGATNRWAMFDQYNGSQSTATDLIEVVIQTGGTTRVDAVALLNIDAAAVQIISETGDGEVYNETFNLVSTDGITDWYAYFFEEIVRKGDLVVTGLPPYVAQTITVILTDTGTVAIGTLVVGQLKVIGGTVYGASVGITDYSRKETDDFGNYTIVERAFSKRGEFKVWTDTNRVDEIQRVLAAYRATPIVYLGTDDYASTQIYGFYKSFEQEIAAREKSWCTLEIEGLT